MRDRAFVVTVATTCCLGALVGLSLSLYLSTWPPSGGIIYKLDQVREKWVDLVLENPGCIATGVISGALLGFLSGSGLGQAGGRIGLTGRPAHSWPPRVAACAFMWVCL